MIDLNNPTAIQRAKAYEYYLRGWLPHERDGVIADIGCGEGRLLSFLKRKGYKKLYAVDMNIHRVQQARQILLEIELGDAYDFLKKFHSAFDLITTIDVIEHFKKDKILEFLNLCFRALVPKGRLIIQTPNADSPFVSSIRYGDFMHEVCFSPNSLKELLQQCGFDKIEVREQCPIPWGYSIISTMRYVGWRAINLSFQLLNAIETGGFGSGICTRVFLISACKP